MRRKQMFHRILAASACLLLGTSAVADTADDCIADFDAAQAVYATSSAGSKLNCVRYKNIFLNYFAFAPAPARCAVDEWQLEARAIREGTGKDKFGECRVMLRGSAGEGCGTEEIVREMDINEFGRWKGYLSKQCNSPR